VRETSDEPWKPHRPFLLDETSADVRRHDDDGVLEIDRITQRVGQDAVLENLKQNVENIRMRLFDFVEQQN
jgi:hypothetical protein